MSIFNVAQAATTSAVHGGAAPQGGMFSSLIFIIGLFAIMYFLLWRPQSKRAKEHRELLSAVSKGDEVITTGGIVGKIVKVTDNFVTLTVSQTVTIQLQKQAISSILPKGTMKELEK